jgi:hypothetical protein
VTTPRRTQAGPRTRQAATPPIPPPRIGEKDPAEMNEPYDLPFPDDRWPQQGRPAYAVVIDQLRGWFPSTQPSLAEALETGHPHPCDPQPDLEAEP